MSRVRWLAADWPFSMASVADHLSSQKYSIDSFDGFIVDRYRTDTVEGRYVQRLRYEETIIDPFGQTEKNGRTEYRTTTFKLLSAFPQIELYDGGSGFRDFSNRLLEACGFNLAISALDLPLEDWISNLRSVSDLQMKLEAVHVSELEINPGVTAKISLHSRSDVFGAFNQLVEGKRHRFDRAQIVVDSGVRPVQIVLSRSGRVAIPEGLDDSILALVRQSIPNKSQG